MADGLIITYTPDRVQLTLTEQQMREAFPNLMWATPPAPPVAATVDVAAGPTPGQQSRPLADAAIAAQDRIQATQIAEQSEDKMGQPVPSVEELLALVKRVTDTPSLGLSHVKEVQKSLGGGRVSFMEPAQKRAFATALQDALELQAVK